MESYNKMHKNHHTQDKYTDIQKKNAILKMNIRMNNIQDDEYEKSVRFWMNH